MTTVKPPAHVSGKHIGILGGTFDPVHMGHLQTADAVQKALALDLMRLMPLAMPVHKDQPQASDLQRLRCIELALESYENLSVDLTELNKQGESYTVDTLKLLTQQVPDNAFYWVMGMDAFNSFHKWKEPDTILSLCNIIVVNRPGSVMNDAVASLYADAFCDITDIKQKKSGGIVELQLPPVAISSTDLRQQLAISHDDKELNTYIPQAVLSYIHQENIYKVNTTRETMNIDNIKDKIVDALEEIKGIEITTLAVGEMTSVADYLIVASGSSNRQVKSLANNVQVQLKKDDVRPIGVEGEREANWVLIDYGDILVHIMTPDVREFYNLEKLWEERPASTEE